MSDGELFEEAGGLIDLPLPEFREDFQSFFDENRKNNLTQCLFPISPNNSRSKRIIKQIKVGSCNISTLSLADIHRSAMKRKGRDVILYPSPAATLTAWKTVQVLRPDYTEREDKVCAMLWAAHSGDLRALRKILSYGAYLDRQTLNGNTVLMEALAGQTENRCKCIELLIKSGARTNLQNKDGHSLLTATAFLNDMPVLRILHQLRDLKYSIDHKTKAGNTALTIAVAKQHFEMARFLVTECGANLLLEDNHQMTAACWAQVYCPPIAGYLCLQLGFTKELEKFVLRRNEILHQLAIRAKQNKIQEGDKELFGVIYGITFVLLMLESSRRIVLNKGMLNSLSNHPLWDYVLEDDDDALDSQILQLLPWFVALGCSMLYNEKTTLQSFIKCGAAKKLITGLNDIVMDCEESVKDGESRLMVQALVVPLMSDDNGRKWLYKVAFECANILKHFLDEDDFLEGNATAVCKAFTMLMVANYAPYKLRDNYTHFSKDAIQKLCPEPTMTVGEKLRGAMAYFEEVKQEAIARTASKLTENILQREEESKRRREDVLLKARMRKMKSREKAKYLKQQEKETQNQDAEVKPRVKKSEGQRKIKPNSKNILKDAEGSQPSNKIVVEERKPEDMYGGNQDDQKKKPVKQKLRRSSGNFDLVWGGAFDSPTRWESRSEEKTGHRRGESAKQDPVSKRRVQPQHKRSASENEGSKKTSTEKVAAKDQNEHLASRKKRNADTVWGKAGPSTTPPGKSPSKIGHQVEVPELMDIKFPEAPVQSTSYASKLDHSPRKVNNYEQYEGQFPLIPPSAITVTELEQMQHSQEVMSLNRTPEQNQISFFYRAEIEKQDELNENQIPEVKCHRPMDDPKSTPTKASNQVVLPNNIIDDLSDHDNNAFQNISNQQKVVLTPGAAGDQVVNEKGEPTPTLNWIPRSKRWKVMFEQLVSMPPEKREKVGSIHFCFKDESLYLARGSNGTVVSVGLRDDGMEVAVKRLLKSNSRCIRNELENLRIPEIEHETIVKYRDYVEDENFGYLALELCECTLEDYVHELRHSNTLHQKSRKLVWQMLRGLDVLHKAKILHMDLKPRNVLIDVRGNVKLADFGISHRMEEDQSTVYRAGVLGTRCWRPRESLIGNKNGRKLPYKTNSDVQVAGMVAYYVMTGGLHPYGQDPSAVELAIAKGVPKFREVHDETLINLMAWMLHPEMDKRKSAPECLTHPFFWTDSKRFVFLYKVSQEPEIRDRSRQSTVRDVIDSAGVWLKLGDWRSEIDQFFLGPQMSLQHYLAKLSDLIRLMADVEDNFNTIAVHLRTLMGDPGNYFLIKFPKVFIVVYEIIRESELRHRRSLTDFFDTNNYVEM